MLLEDTLELLVSDKEAVLAGDLEEAIDHGILVSKLALLLSKELELDENFCYTMAKAGLVHDIGKLKLGQFLYKRSNNTLTVEEMKYIRMHPAIGYEILQSFDYEEVLLLSVYHHHENYDGTGYPGNLKEEDIPLGARILRICDVYAALISDRRYRVAFDKEMAIKLMIEEVKNFDMKIFLAFLRVVHSDQFNEVDEFVEHINKKIYSWRKILHDGYY
ncbi:HD domain-containing phosphohydrolase [Anaerocolumna sp. AGMB13025]|uniref:HD-GYP domain-containing protein n=1 Tax=Anaerocolumna sp. AGMB13025 TaxID=3039116 RepID=UPI00241C1554|nr:HD domain-containing phosphohydrolase [Anaerocolumna sp. AGMB13025]WFR56174.1 HD domain-containing phosphohydrolase [Anaerocolumna sp. AGMB13025]